MLERLVANWLTSAGERGYETAFSQLLVIEGHKVLHGPVHHPFEHGKDIVALSPQGALYAFQLKGGDLGLRDVEAITPQLLALAATPVTYPGVTPNKRPDRAFLVTNGTLSPPARDRLAQFNAANQGLAFAIVEAIEYEQLLGRFANAHGGFMPVEPAELERLLRIYLGDGRGTFPITDYLRVAAALIDDSDQRVGQSAELRVARAALLTSYMLTPWSRLDNHLAIAQAWLSLCALTLERAANGWNEQDWGATYEICLAAARSSLADLLEEALESEDLVIPDTLDSYVYGARALLVCGYLSAFAISERVLGETAVWDRVSTVLKREVDYVRVPGEAAAPFVFGISSVLAPTSPEDALRLSFQYSKELIHSNQPTTEGGVPNPYYSFEEILDTGLDEHPQTNEDFVGSSYTAFTALEWFARRDLRRVVELLWPFVSRLTLLSFRISRPARLLSVSDPDGELLSTVPPLTLSWGQLRRESKTLSERRLPDELWRKAEFLPYLPLILPHRYNSDVAKAIDYTLGGLTEIEYDVDKEKAEGS